MNTTFKAGVLLKHTSHAPLRRVRQNGHSIWTCSLQQGFHIARWPGFGRFTPFLLELCNVTVHIFVRAGVQVVTTVSAWRQWGEALPLTWRLSTFESLAFSLEGQPDVSDFLRETLVECWLQAVKKIQNCTICTTNFNQYYKQLPNNWNRLSP